MFKKSIVRFVQQQLAARGFDPGQVDGIYGDKTEACLASFPGVPADYSKRRKLVVFIQLLSHETDGVRGVERDGYWGPQTEFAYEQLQSIVDTGAPERTWRPEEVVLPTDSPWPSQRDEQDIFAFYGEPGDNLVMVDLPYRHRLAWDLSSKVTRTRCHAKVADSLYAVLENVLAGYGEARIRELRLDHYGGCYNDRPMRGGTRRSMHSWGIALDYDPSHNKLKWGRGRASFAQPAYDEWWKCWEDEGWVSLGRTRNFDWMHVQAVTL